MALTPTTSRGTAGATAKLYDYTVSGSDKASIDTFVDGDAVASFAGYDVLEWLLYVRTDEAVTRSSLSITVNNDTGANYDRVYTSVNNVTAGVGNTLAQAAWLLLCPGASATAAKFAVYAFAMPNYLGTTGQKFATCEGGSAEQVAASTDMFALAFGWRSASAVTRIAVTPTTAAKKLVVGSRLLVFGR